jgi:signal transduction histidine kinase
MRKTGLYKHNKNTNIMRKRSETIAKLLKTRYFWYVAIMAFLAGIFSHAPQVATLIHLPLVGDWQLACYVAVYRLLFLLSVAIAAWRFGVKGGLIVCLIVGPAILSIVVADFSNPSVWLDVAVVAIGIMFSWVVGKQGEMKRVLEKTTEEIKRQSTMLESEVTERKRVEEELRRSHEQLRNLSAHIESATEAERTSIAREVHDELGQALTAIKMDLAWLNKRLPKGQKALIKKTGEISRLIGTTIQTVKRISTKLRPGVLDDLGLIAAIEWQVQEFQERTRIKCELTAEGEDINLDRDLATAVFRILQEALTNVARHANATRVEVSLKKGDGQLLLQVRDNGRGITEKQIAHPKSFGLIGMRERVRSWDGRVKIDGISGRGTIVTVSIPLKRKEEGNDKNTSRR